jgi:hypothetical protein
MASSLATGVGARRRITFGPCGQLGSRERGPVEDVAHAHVQAVEAEASDRLRDDRDSRHDHRRAGGLEAGHAAPLLDGERGQPRQLLVDRAERDAMAVDVFADLLRQAEVEGGEGRHGSGDADRLLRARGDLVRDALGEERRDGVAHRLEILAEALGEPDAADVEARTEAVRHHELRRAAADVHDDAAGAERPAGADAPDRERGLVLAPQEQGLEAVAPLDLPQEGLAVLRVADRAGGDGEDALGAVALGDAAVVGEDVPDARDRDRQQPATTVDALPQARDREAPVDVVERPVLDVGHEQARGVRAEVDGGDAGHLRGTSPVTRDTVDVTSSIAADSTARRARLRWRRRSAASTRADSSGSVAALAETASADAVTVASSVVSEPENERNPRQASRVRTTRSASEPRRATTAIPSDGQTQSTGRILAARGAIARRRRGLQQIAVVAAAAGVYESARLAITPDWDTALSNADRIWAWESAARMNLEEPIQQAFLAIPDAVEALNVFYFVGHFLLTAIFFVWLYRRDDRGFRAFRNGFFTATMFALVIHWQFPTAPPRLADVGLVDTLRALSGIDIGSQSSEALSNPVFAVPSLHAGYAAGVGAGLVLYARRRWLRVVGVLYPLLVVLTIVVTGNHFLFDAAAGLLVMALGFGLAALVARVWERDDGAILEPATRGGAVR